MRRKSVRVETTDREGAALAKMVNVLNAASLTSYEVDRMIGYLKVRYGSHRNLKIVNE
jgi:hypothetical protein